MATYNNEKYYWLKLKKDFFKRHDIKIIEDMDNGKDYILFYLKLLCESIDHNGNLRFSDTIPYNEKMLSSVTNTNIDIVRSALKVFRELNMLEVLDTGTIYMNEIQNMIGFQTISAKRKQIQRQNKQKLLTGGQWVDKCPPEIEIEIEIEKDKKESIKKKSSHSFVAPSLDSVLEYANSKGVKDLGQKFYEYYTTGDRDWVDSKGKKVLNWKQKLLTWINYNSKDNSDKKPSVNIKSRDYTSEEIESLYDNLESLEV